MSLVPPGPRYRQIEQELHKLPLVLRRQVEGVLDGTLRPDEQQARLMRRQVCEALGSGSTVLRRLRLRLTESAEMADDPRCARCGLRDHTAQSCDLKTIDYYASMRRE